MVLYFTITIGQLQDSITARGLLPKKNFERGDWDERPIIIMWSSPASFISLLSILPSAYFIFDLNSSGEFTGTYNSSPTGYTSGDFSGLNMLQPLSHNGKYFCYHNSGKCYIIFLDYAFEPAKGITALTNFTPEYNLPNSTQISTQWWNRMYVSSGRIFFAHYHGNSPLNMVYDITIDGVAPDDIT